MSKIIKVYFTKTATTDFCNQYLEMLEQIFPEDKIIEFAKSEEFTTYKKLFNELGLN